jgi:DNA-binding transcriptional regulator YiaG
MSYFRNKKLRQTRLIVQLTCFSVVAYYYMDAHELKTWREPIMSRAALGLKLKTSPRTIEAWEQGRRPIPDREADRIMNLMIQDTLKIPLPVEVKEKLERLARERGVDPALWALELIRAALS